MKSWCTFFAKTILKAGLSTLVVTLASCSPGSGQKSAGTETKTVDLQTAVMSDNLDMVKQHIASKSNLNEKEPFGGSTPLITAAVFGKTEAAKLLIEAGADLNIQNNDGSTALHSAAFFGRPEIVKMLLAKKADKTVRNKYGSTPLETVAGNFDDVRPVYDMMVKALGPYGLKLDYAYLQTVRPEISALLK